jgi:hypothetical protein
MLYLLLPLIVMLLDEPVPTAFKPVQLKPEQTPDSIYLRGRLIEVSGKPVPTTILKLRRLHLTTVSNTEGEFIFSIPLRQALRISEDKLIVASGAYQANFLYVKIFTAGPVIFTVFTTPKLSMTGCSLKNIIGEKRATELRKAAGRKN